MYNDWPLLTLKEAGVALLDCEHRTPPPAERGFPYVTIPQMSDGRLKLAEARRITGDHFAEWTRKALPKPNDVVLSRRCNPGETAYVAHGESFALGQNLVLLRADGSRVLPEFLRWLVRGDDWWNQVRRFLNAGAVFDSLKCAEVPKFQLPIPPLQEQISIAATLGSLDDKIDLNRRMGATLEEMARAIFRAWFVDFDPVRAKASGERHFPGMPQAQFDTLPDRFKDSPLGPVPEGWDDARHRVAKLEAIGWLLIGDGYRAKRSELASQGVPFVRAGNVNGEVRADGAELLGPIAVAKAGVKQSQVWDTVFTSKGTVGRIALVTPTTGQVVYAPQVCFWRSLRPDVLSRYYLHMWMRSDDFTQQWKAVKGETDMADFVSLSDQRAMTVFFPPPKMQQAFNGNVQPLIELQAQLAAESRKLAEIRDYLLPKLLSGRVRVEDVENMVSGAVL